MSDFALCAAFKKSRKSALEICLDKGWMDITFSANSNRVPQFLGDFFDGSNDAFPATPARVQLLTLLQSARHKSSPRPGAEIFSGKIMAANSPQIMVHIVGLDGVLPPFLVKILE